MPTTLVPLPNLDGPKRLTYVAISVCLLIFSVTRFWSLLSAAPYPWPQLVSNSVLLLLSAWLLWTLRRAPQTLQVLEQVALWTCTALYFFYQLHRLLTHAAPNSAALSDVLVLALSAAFYLFWSPRQARRGVGAVLGVGLLSQWWALLHAFSWTQVPLLLARNLVVVAALLLIMLLGRYRAAWTEARDSARTLRDMAHTDDLTGLPNRRAAYRHFEDAMRSAQTPLSVLLIDIDNFKRVNDTHGHEAGDQVIQGVTRALQGALGKSGVLVRWGGEEYLVLLRGVTLGQALHDGEALRAAVEALESPYGPLTVSVGVSSRVTRDTVQALVRRADQGLYRAKERGKNRVVAQED